MKLVCRICGNERENRTVVAREMMFGTREEFEYLECSACGTLQICEVPDLSRHYPEGYLSFDASVPVAETAFRRATTRYVGQHLLKGTSLIGKWLYRKSPWLGGYFPESLRRFPLGIDFNSHILDFGCGDGALLRSLHYFGFTDLTGADAFIEQDIVHPEGLTIYKRGLSQLEPPFDLIMLHHSFEHLADPARTLEELRNLMQETSWCLIRIPVKGYAWEKYGTNWVQMDPPRHLFLYTEKAFRELVEAAGFSVEYSYYDSGAFQFWGSEQYALDIPLEDERSMWKSPSSGLFTPEQIEDWTAEAEILNREGRGDMACFYLKRSE